MWWLVVMLDVMNHQRIRLVKPGINQVKYSTFFRKRQMEYDKQGLIIKS